MKHETRKIALVAAALSLTAALGTVRCVQTAFALHWESPKAGAGLWILTAIFCTALSTHRWGRLLIPALGAAALGLLWQDPGAREQILSFGNVINTAYDRAYGWGRLPIPLPQYSGLPADVPLSMLGCTVIAAFASALCRRRGGAIALLSMGIPLIACLIVTDTVPSEKSLFLCLTVLLLLILTASVRTDSSAQGNRLLLQILLPVAATLAIIFLRNPRQDYVNRSPQIRQALLSYAAAGQQRLENSSLPFASPPSTAPQVNLQSLHPRQKLGIPILEVTAQETGTLYLRSQDYDVYTGTGWQASSDRRETVSASGAPINRVTIRTRAIQSTLLLPYYPPAGTELTGGGLKNSANLTRYTMDCHEYADFPFPESTCLELPSGTAAGAARILDTLSGDLSTTASAASSIGEYIRTVARYDLNPGTMPESEEDFALWFLEDGEAGYCVHFATAAVVLLRSAGIPARYVTGYLAQGIAGETAVVTTDEAHAWAEYYDYSAGSWFVLEATPAEDPPDQESSTPEIPSESAYVPPPPVSAEAHSLPLSRLGAGVLVSILILLPLGILCILRYLICMTLRKRRQNRSDTRTAALSCWQEASLLARLLKESIPEELETIAEKALYSREPPTRKELESFSLYRQRCRRRLGKRSLYRRLIDRFWFCAY